VKSGVPDEYTIMFCQIPLNFSLSQESCPYCGNGVVENGEACDTGLIHMTCDEFCQLIMTTTTTTTEEETMPPIVPINDAVLVGLLIAFMMFILVCCCACAFVLFINLNMPMGIQKKKN